MAERFGDLVDRLGALFVPPREETEEVLDGNSGLQPHVLRSLRDLRRINRYLGGRTVYRRLLRRLGGATPPDVMDLGTGTSDLLAATRDLARRRIGVDFKIEHLAYGRSLDGAGVLRVAGDAFRLPFRDGAVDVVTSSHFFHHFSPVENAAILDECLRLSRRGVIVTDTRRHIAPLLFVRLLGALGLFGPITRLDAPASVRQGYTCAEVESIARNTVAREWALVRMWPFRFGLFLRK